MIYVTTEKQVENEIKRYVRGKGGKCHKLHGSAMSGKNTVDLVGHVFGVPFICEVKAPGKKPTAYQEYELASFRPVYAAVWADSLDMFVSKIKGGA